MGGQGILFLIGIKILVMNDDLIAIFFDFKCSRPLDVDGIKMFDEDDQATIH